MVAIRLHNPPTDADDFFADDCDPEAASDAVTERIGELESLLNTDDSTPDSPQPAGEVDHLADAKEHLANAKELLDSTSVAATVTQATKLVRAKTRYLAASLVLSELEQRRDSIKARIKSQKEIVAELYREVVNEGGGGDEDEDADDEGDGEWHSGGDREGDADEPTLAEPSREIIEGPSLQATSSWASTPTQSIGLDAIEGMGPKKLTAIYEAAPTLGKLESLRADVYGGGLTQIKGVGPALAERIEDAILEWLTKNRDSEVLNFASGGDSGDEGRVAQGDSSSGHGDAAALLIDATDASDESSRGGDAVPGSLPLSADASPDAPLVPASDDIAAAFPQVDDGGSGEAADAEPEAAAQPVGPPKKPKRAKASKQPPTAADIATSTDPAAADDRGDLSARAALIRSRLIDGFYADTETTDAFNDGRDARRNDLAIIDACNWMPGERQDHWLLGWVAADLELSGVGQQTVGA